MKFCTPPSGCAFKESACLEGESETVSIFG